MNFSHNFLRNGFRLLPLLLSMAVVSGCHHNTTGPLVGNLPSEPLAIDWQVEAAQLLTTSFWPEADMLVSSEQQGLFVLDATGNVLSHLPGTFGALDHRTDNNGLLAALVDVDQQQALVVRLDAQSKQWQTPVHIPRPEFKIDGICLHRDAQHNEFAFLIGEEGLGEQWLVAQQETPLPAPLKIRRLSLPPESEHCRVDDLFERLYINEENVGLWVYPAHPEADLARQPVELIAPFGDIEEALAAMAVVAGQAVFSLDPDTARLHRHAYTATGWQAETSLTLDNLDEPERLDVRATDHGFTLLLRDDNGLHRAQLPWQPAAIDTPAQLPVLTVTHQTDPVPSLGDAADDPAIWVHPSQPEQSLILGTDKQGGLVSYNLDGKQVQDLRAGRINNVDVRAGFRLGEQDVDLAVGSNRDHNSLHLFAIHRRTGLLTDIGQVATPLKDIYGLCLFQDSRDNSIHAIANDKDGSFLQYRLSAPQGRAEGELVRRFAVNSQPEGCVADDVSQRLYVGEEDVAVWVLDARADQPATLEQVIAVDGELVHDDIEGLAIYRRGDHAWLVISSQGNNSYVIVDADAPYTLRGAFRLGLNADAGIDGASETDGLEVTSANLGGAWSDGLLVVQDGRKRMPEDRQNYKFLPWSSVAETLGL